MKTKTNTQLYALTLFGALVTTTTTQASSDYGPAIWNPACNGHWYTSGYGHKFHVIHDMEGYYLSTISYFQNCNTTASVHYCVNGLKDTSTDHAAGEITQMVLEAYYAWHALCWNTYSTGTEHEGFASNPAWYTEAQYQASAGITIHIASKFAFAKDRNHIVGHNEWQNSNWTAWAGPNLGINTSCNTHHDPGVYWDWAHYMSLVNPPPPLTEAWQRIKGDFNGDGKDDVVALAAPSAGTMELWVFQSSGTNFTPTLWYTQGGWTASNSKFIAGDFNGDGKTDVMGVYDYGNNTTRAWVFLSTGTNFAAPVQWWLSTGWNMQSSTWLAGDFNGDGKTDALGIYDYGSGSMKMWMFSSSGTNFAAPVQWFTQGGWYMANAKMVAGDFNHDGKTDVAGVYDNGNASTAIWVFPSTGSAFSTPTSWWSSVGGWDAKHSTWEPGDFSGDGKTDIVGVYDYGNNTTKLWTFVSSGSAFAAPVLWYSSTTWDAQRSKWAWGDFNGDGKADVVGFYNNGGSASTLWTFLSTGSAFPSAAQWWHTSSGFDWMIAWPF